jgi:hypothetical protein
MDQTLNGSVITVGEGQAIRRSSRSPRLLQPAVRRPKRSEAFPDA